jgi:hypothetical protein
MRVWFSWQHADRKTRSHLGERQRFSVALKQDTLWLSTRCAKAGEL